MTPSFLLKLLRNSLHDLYPDRELESIGRLLMEHITGLNRVQIHLNPELALTAEDEQRVGAIIARLREHEPIQYILGETEFYGLKLKVRRGVLIPRGETEELVEWILKAQGAGRKAQGMVEGTEGGRGEGCVRILDIGCGSGAIAIALARSLPAADVVASDISEEALLLTRENAEMNAAPIALAFLDILDPNRIGVYPDYGNPTLFQKPFDCIVSNPPYVPRGEMTSMDLHVVEFEPETALFVPDADPLVFYRAICEFAAKNLTPHGQVFVEIHDRLGEETVALFGKWFSNVELRKDIPGRDRMILATNG
jgi:release factor glutamine methyltransferase